jgi:hypothetical protein
MLMRTVHLQAEGQEAIPVKLATHVATTLLECHAPGPFLAHVTQGRWTEPLAPDAYLRGILIPDEGAIFSICGPLGVVADEVVRLTDGEARRLILDRLR